MELLQAKLLALFSLGLGSFLFGMLPLYLKNRMNFTLLMSALLCFGAGVLLATSLIHILPETKMSLPESAELVFCGGFFILYVIDEIVHFIYGELPQHSHTNHQNDARFSNYGSVENLNVPLLLHNHSNNDIHENELPSQLCHVGHQEPCHESPISHLGLIVALCVHSILEGLAVGLETTAEKVLLLLAAIACHKLVVGFCLGVELIRSDSITTLRLISSIAVFSMGASGGIVLGLLAEKFPIDSTIQVLPTLQGLAGGTLLYVTVCEVLPRERAKWHQEHRHRVSGIIQLTSVIVGFTGMAIITKYLG